MIAKLGKNGTEIFLKRILRKNCGYSQRGFLNTFNWKRFLNFDKAVEERKNNEVVKFKTVEIPSLLNKFGKDEENDVELKNVTFENQFNDISQNSSLRTINYEPYNRKKIEKVPMKLQRTPDVQVEAPKKLKPINLINKIMKTRGTKIIRSFFLEMHTSATNLFVMNKRKTISRHPLSPIRLNNISHTTSLYYAKKEEDETEDVSEIDVDVDSPYAISYDANESQLVEETNMEKDDIEDETEEDAETKDEPETNVKSSIITESPKILKPNITITELNNLDNFWRNCIQELLMNDFWKNKSNWRMNSINLIVQRNQLMNALTKRNRGNLSKGQIMHYFLNYIVNNYSIFPPAKIITSSNNNNFRLYSSKGDKTLDTNKEDNYNEGIFKQMCFMMMNDPEFEEKILKRAGIKYKNPQYFLYHCYAFYDANTYLLLNRVS